MKAVRGFVMAVKTLCREDLLKWITADWSRSQNLVFTEDLDTIVLSVYSMYTARKEGMRCNSFVPLNS